MGNKAIYAVGLAALLVLGFAAFGMPSARQQPADAYAGAGGSGYQLAAPASVPPECGDINDPQNLQHLSHHPDRFQACYRVVDPQEFRAAVGRDVSEFLR